MRYQLLMTFLVTVAGVCGLIHMGPPPTETLHRAVWHKNAEEITRNVKWRQDGALNQVGVAKTGPRNGFEHGWEMWCLNCTPLHLAASSADVASMRLLIDRGADVNARDEEGEFPLHRVVRGRWQGGAWVWATVNGSTEHLEAAELLLAFGCNINARDSTGRTALCLAVMNADFELLRLFVRRGADVNIADDSGSTPLHYAVAGGKWGIFCLDPVSEQWGVRDPGHQRCALVVKMLIDSGADVNAVDSQGRTPADIAAAAGYHDIADTLRQSRITSVRQP